MDVLDTQWPRLLQFVLSGKEIQHGVTVELRGNPVALRARHLPLQTNHFRGSVLVCINRGDGSLPLFEVSSPGQTQTSGEPLMM